MTDRRDEAAHRRRTVSVALVVAAATVLSARAYLGAVADQAAIEPTALANAEHLRTIEAWTGLDAVTAWSEGPLAGWARPFFATFYALGYWPFLAVAGLVAWRHHRLVFWRYAVALATSGLVGITTMALFPAAPPRLVGFTDGMTGSPLQSLAHPDGAFNQFGAMPSFHVAWSVLAAAALVQAVPRRRIAVVAAAQPMLMSLTVVVTANHWTLDVIAAVILAAAAWTWASPIVARIPSSAVSRRTEARATEARATGARAPGTSCAAGSPGR